jgi:hypothetical protein
MPSLRKDLRSELERTIVKARDIAETAAAAALQALAVGEPKPFPHMNADARALRNRLRERGRAAGDVRNDFTTVQTIDHLAQLVGYEHWHRMIFARFLAENNLLLEPEHQVALSLDDVQELAREEGIDLWQLAGSYAQRMLPEVFRNDDPALEVALAREDRLKLEKLLADLDPAVFTADDSLGWTYQFWQTKRKDEVNASGKKIGAKEISPVTQLFTEDYMVEFLLHNTLGAWWAGKLGPIVAADEAGARAKAALPVRDSIGITWTYLRFIQDEATKTWKPAAGTFEGWPKTAAEIKFLDPCMGSGHFPVFALPLLARLRMEEEKLSATEAIHAVLRDSIHGLELDPRCCQIGAFNLALTAWKLGGYRALPPLHVACCGLAPQTQLKDWVALAGENQKIQRGMEKLHSLFTNAPVLGSLINPRAGEGDLLVAAFHELQPLLEKALAQETKDDAAHEMAVTARGLAKAAEILAGQFTLVATNVPYLGRGKQDEVLADYCERVHPDAKADLATCFVERSLTFCARDGSTALVTPQNWLFLKRYKRLRQDILTRSQVNAVGRLGAGAFETIGGEVVNVALVVSSSAKPGVDQVIASVSAESDNAPQAKARRLSIVDILMLKQAEQLKNPDSAIIAAELSDQTLLKKYADSYQGIGTSDNAQFLFAFWEHPLISDRWRTVQTAAAKGGIVGGLHFILPWEGGFGRYYRHAMALKAEGRLGGWKSGGEAWGKRGIAINVTSSPFANFYGGDMFDTTVAVIVPRDEGHIAAILACVHSPTYLANLRIVDQALSITEHTLLKVPFDLAHWQKVAAEKYPHGLPKPFSSDPTQWLFNGHPAGADQPLHVAVARLLGYQWPRQTGSSFPDCPALEPDGLELFCDNDGIVCLTPLRGEAKAADRLRKLLDAAYADASWNERQLLTATGAKATNLEDWLRDEFFEQHAKLFHHRPFVWHIWDGRPDGFHALVNYHQLAAPDGAGHKLLETLTYAYLGDWIRRQKDDSINSVPGAESRLEAATILQQELKHILAGEPPYDLFIRWKPLHQQPIGWHPDLNDGVRLNIRPFLYAKDVKKKDAGILRWRPNIKWTKDRGTEPERAKSDFPWFWTWDEKTKDFQGSHKFDGSRWNDLHYSNEAKQRARESHQSKIS